MFLKSRTSLLSSLALKMTLIVSIWMPLTSAQSQSVFDGPDCVKCIPHFPHLGQESVYISQRFADQICRSYQHNNGFLQATENVGVMRFGSLESYYENLYRVTCTEDNMREASPLFAGIATAPDNDYLRHEVFNTLEKISEEARLLLLNRPQLTTRRTRRTLLDQVLIQKRNAQNAGNQHNVRILEHYERRIRELGGLRFEELSREQLLPYRLPPISGT